MKDLLGNELQVGDTVAHIYASRSSVSAHKKVISEINPNGRIYFVGSPNRAIGWGTEGRVIKVGL